MSNGHDVIASTAARREHPFLYQWNRRLRHLRGISLRNLNLKPSSSRNRGRTITDDEYNLKTPATALLQREARSLHHAKSFDQLIKATSSSLEPVAQSSTTAQKGSTPSKRPTNNLRRRSTLHWTSSNAVARQRTLERLEVNRLIDTWFSVHHEELRDPIYVSEVVKRAMNPSFSFFDLDKIPGQFTRSDNFVLKVWAKSELTKDYQLLIQLNINLQSLQFLGRDLEHFYHPLPENFVLVHLEDGIYTAFTDMPGERQPLPPLTALMKGMPQARAAPFDVRLKLSNTDDVLQDVCVARYKVENDIQHHLTNLPQVERNLTLIGACREQLRTLRRASEAAREARKESELSRDHMRESMKRSHELMDALPGIRSASQAERAGLSSLRSQYQTELVGIGELAHGQIRRVSSTLLHILPIEPIKSKSLQFTMRHIHLPNSNFSDTNRDEIAAVLVLVAQLVCQLSLYLSVPLPYPVSTTDAIPSIADNISAGIVERRFQLQPIGPAYKFEYAVFLLNKDIEYLMNRFGLRVVDIRHTLPNLKYLLFVLTAGNEAEPSRKIGGIRGLLSSFGTRSPAMSRRTSEDSVNSQTSTLVGKKQENYNEKTDEQDEVYLLPLRARGLPYRRSGLSRNV